MSELPLHLITFWWDHERAKHRWNYEFTAEHVDRLYRGWKRNLTKPFEFHVFTCDKVPVENISERDIHIHRMPDAWLSKLHKFGRCYCKLGIFSWDTREFFGPAKLLTLDLDMCVVGNCDHLIKKGYQSDFTGYLDTKNPRMYSGSMHMHTAGECRQIWDAFSLVSELDLSNAEMVGSDQCWMTTVLGESRYPRWTEADGIHDYWKIEDMGDGLPENACLVMVNGMHRDVSLPEFQQKHKWLREDWI